jgi:hypothetical protein
MSASPAFKIPAETPASSPSPAGQPKSAEFQFERPDWMLFGSLNTLPQKAGVSKDLLRRLVLKELTDNALDSGAETVRVGVLAESHYFVEDGGPGIPGPPEDIGRLFSINRPLVSTKLWRRPLRGAMGNGLRVVVGAVAASRGSLIVETGNRRLVLSPQPDGTTKVETAPIENRKGTRIEVAFGPGLPQDEYALHWAEMAIALAGGDGYAGRTSPYWYDGAQWLELLRAAGNRPVRDLIAHLDGCTGGKAGKITSDLKGVACSAVTRDQAIALLQAARAAAKPVRAERLGCVGPLSSEDMPDHHAIERGVFETGTYFPIAEIPYVVEAWADALKTGEDDADITVCVNRTPITGEVYAYRDDKRLRISGCGLYNLIDAPKGDYILVINVTSPYCPITTDGKEPDLRPFRAAIATAVKKAIRRARRWLGGAERDEPVTRKGAVLDNLDAAVAKASGDGAFRFNQRQLLYVRRQGS